MYFIIQNQGMTSTVLVEERIVWRNKRRKINLTNLKYFFRSVFFWKCSLFFGHCLYIPNYAFYNHRLQIHTLTYLIKWVVKTCFCLLVTCIPWGEAGDRHAQENCTSAFASEPQPCKHCACKQWAAFF